MSLSPLPCSYKDRSHVGLSPLPVTSYGPGDVSLSTHNTSGSRAWLLDAVEYGIMSIPLMKLLC